MLLTTNLFLRMTAYYLIKPLRDCLILGDVGPEIRAYAGAAGALLLLLVIPLYGKLAIRLNRIRLINAVTAFFGQPGPLLRTRPAEVSFSVVFFLWVGLFNLMLVAPFWAFTNDVYTPEQGKRLFAIIGIGSSLGAILGAGAASRLFAAIGGYAILLVAAALLGICMVLTNVVHRREETRSGPRPCNEPLKSMAVSNSFSNSAIFC